MKYKKSTQLAFPVDAVVKIDLKYELNVLKSAELCYRLIKSLNEEAHF